MNSSARMIFAACAALTLAAAAHAQGTGANTIAEPAPAAPLPDGALLYHTLTGRDAQVIFTSDAPLENIVGKSNAVVGFAVPGPADQPAKLASATWILPIRSLATGIPLRDEHMLGKEWLDADTSDTITFVLSSVDDIKEIKRGDGFSTWSATLNGKLTLHGVTRELKVEGARLSFFDESPKTAKIAPGNLIFLKCDYTVQLSDFGIQHADIGTKVSDQVKLSQMLRLSSATPEAIKTAAQKDETQPKPTPQPSAPAKAE